MTNNKIHTSNVTLTDKQIINAIFKEFRKDELIDFAKQNIAHDRNTAFGKVIEAGMRDKSHIFTCGEHSKFAFDENGNLQESLLLDWSNRVEEEKSKVVANRMIEIITSFGFSVEWRGSWWYSILIEPRKGVEWNRKEKQWVKIEEEVSK